jgi:hypothetical protein
VALPRASGIVDLLTVTTGHQLNHISLSSSWSAWETLGSGLPYP